MTTPITKEQELRAFITGFLTDPAHDEHSENSMTAQVFRIALAAMDAEPIYQWRERYEEGSLWDDCTKEQYDGFAKNPECEARVLYTSPPAPIIPPAQHWDELCRQHPDMSIGDAIIRAAGWNLCRHAMLNHSENERDMVEPVSQPYKLPATRFQQVADLYGITSPTGSETSFTFDAFEASSFGKSGWSVQEYVELERYQQAVTGNSPVIPDGSNHCPCCGKKLRRTCSVEGCSGKHVAHGLCQKHYDMKRWEDPEQVNKFREAGKRFRDKKKSASAAAPQQEGEGQNQFDEIIEI